MYDKIHYKLKKEASLYIQFMLKSHLIIFSFLVQQIRRNMEKYNSLFQTYLAMKSSLFTGNSLFKRSEYQYLTQHSKASLGNTIWEFPGDNNEGERLESKSWEEWRSAWERSGEKQERHDGVCSSRAIMYKWGRTLWAAPEDRAVSMKLLSALHKEREAWGWAPSQRGCQWSPSIFQVPPIC